MSVALRVVCILLGSVLVLWASISAVLTFVVPRGNPVALTRWVFTLVATGFRGVALRFKRYETRDRIMAVYAPFGLLLLPVAWLIVVYYGFTLIFLGLRVTPIHHSLMMSASSLFTLGFVGSNNLPVTAAIAIEAGLGLGLVAILISYLPSIYSSYSRREIRVTSLETFAGSPPSAETLLPLTASNIPRRFGTPGGNGSLILKRRTHQFRSLHSFAHHNLSAPGSLRLVRCWIQRQSLPQR